MKKIVISINPDGSIKSETFGYDSPSCVDASKEVLNKLVDLDKVDIDMKDTSVSDLDTDFIQRNEING